MRGYLYAEYKNNQNTSIKLVSSGAITNMEELEAFDKWWSEIDVSHYITPRDFMWYNEKEKSMGWVFAAPDNYDNFVPIVAI